MMLPGTVPEDGWAWNRSSWFCVCKCLQLGPRTPLCPGPPLHEFLADASTSRLVTVVSLLM